MSDEPTKKKVRPKYLEANHDRAKRSTRHEQRLADRLGGKRLPRSGGLAWSKWDAATAGGDISVPDFLFEHKRTVNKSMSIPHEWLNKVVEGARRTTKDPGLIMTFERDGYPPDDWAVIPLSVLERLLRAVKASEGEGSE